MEKMMKMSTDLQAAIDEISPMHEEQILDTGNEVLVEEEASACFDLTSRIGAMPWWVISATVHSVLFLLAALITVSVPVPKQDNIIIRSTMIKKDPPKYDPQKKRDVFKQPHEIVSKEAVTTDKPLVVHEDVEVSDHFETDNNMDSATAAGSEDAISDIPLGGTGSTGSMGVGASGGLAGAFGYRGGGGRKRAVKRFGGSEKTESAVEAALRWLARHQDADGAWDSLKWEGDNKDKVSMTGLAMLAFLGAGHTSKTGLFKDNVKRAEKWLVDRLENENTKRGKYCPYGWFYASMYSQGIGALALAEAYGMTKNTKLLKPAQAAIDYIEKAQGPYEAWNYHSKKGKTGRNDTSVSGWCLMALKSAKTAGLKVKGDAFQGAMAWLNAATSPSTGYCTYAAKDINALKRLNGTMATCAAGMIMRQFMGATRNDPMVVAAAKSMTSYLPEWNIDSKSMFHPVPKGKNGTNYYYWYYGSLGMFQVGGEYWKKWNASMKKVLLENQRKGGPLDGTIKDIDGSFDPVGGGGVHHGGRVMSTALAALSLEVYYRYLPLYGK
jgi:hypothetical protein